MTRLGRDHFPSRAKRLLLVRSTINKALGQEYKYMRYRFALALCAPIIVGNEILRIDKILNEISQMNIIGTILQQRCLD